MDDQFREHTSPLNESHWLIVRSWLRKYSRCTCVDSVSFALGRVNGWPSWDREDHVSQSCGHRMRDYLLQCVLLHPHLQIQGRVRETCSAALRNGKLHVHARGPFSKTSQHQTECLNILSHSSKKVS